MLIEERTNNKIKKILATFILHILNYSLSIIRIFYFKIYRKTKKCNIEKGKKNFCKCLECGIQINQSILSLDEYENQFCERCEIDDNEGIM
jgi:hypothetical protein